MFISKCSKLACCFLFGCTGYVPAQAVIPLEGAVDAAVEAAPEVESPFVPLPTPAPSPPSTASAGASDSLVDAGAGAGALALRIARNGQFADYLTDGEGRALYMFADDVSASEEAACVGDCAREWPPFDLPLDAATRPLFDPAIDAHEVTRMHRQDGVWQTRYKGHPLYYRAEELAGDVTADGHDGAWFVARDYFAFFSTTASFEPTGTSDQRHLYLTDGFGRTLYVCLDDRPTTDASAASSACSGDCLANRPPWSASASLRTTRLPTSLELSVLGAFVRSDGIVQLTYRGWPLYYFRDDAVPGDTSGHNQGAWRAIDPIAFGEGESL